MQQRVRAPSLGLFVCSIWQSARASNVGRSACLSRLQCLAVEGPFFYVVPIK